MKHKEKPQTSTHKKTKHFDLHDISLTVSYYYKEVKEHKHIAENKNLIKPRC